MAEVPDGIGDPAHLSTDIFYARSTDSGVSFTKNVQVTTAPTNETCCGADLGDQYGRDGYRDRLADTSPLVDRYCLWRCVKNAARTRV